MLRISTLLVTVIIATTGFAQVGKLKTKVVLAPDGSSKSPMVNLLPLNDRALFVTRAIPAKTGINKYGDDTPEFELVDREKLFVIRSQQPQLRFKEAPLFFETVVLLGKDPVMIASRRDTLLGTTQLYWQKADPNLTSGHLPFELLCVFDTRTYGDGTKLKDGEGYRDPFTAIASPDGSKVLLYSPAIKSIKGETYCPMVVVNASMKVVWKQTLEVPDGARYQDVTVDVLGNALFTERTGMAVKDMKKDTTSYTVRLHQVNGSGVSDVDLGLGKTKFAKGIVYTVLPDSTILVAGIYSGTSGQETPTFGDYYGVLRAGTGRVELKATSTIAQDTDDKAATNNAMRMINVLPKSDGGAYLIREYFQETDAVDSKTAKAGLRWIHGPLVITSVGPGGKEIWSNTFRRLFYTDDSTVGDVFSVVFEDQLVLVLVDSEQQSEKRKSGDKKLNYLDFKSPFSTTIQFDEKGEFKAKKILSTSGANDFIVGSKLYHFGPSEYYMTGSHKLNTLRTQPVRMDLSLDN